ncbi:GNAT family N-acetyltransferase [Kistimonas asteriae]|uniref:GNAT family N-acetyltransferase n=1 Tax=Kistimonas asteriae TaxID=517724 RepID=UPI001BA43D47|nr:GNAT family N-acetyltransferase [Kistimonas asteriae]
MSLLITDTTLLGGLPLPAQEQKPASLIPARSRAQWCFDLGCQALKDGFWALAKGCYRTCLSRYGDNPATRFNLALCEVATGRPEAALSHLVRARQLQPEDEDIQALIEELAARDRYWRSLAWFERRFAKDGDISLEPVDERHLPAMLFQFRDPAIARRVNLPPMKNRKDIDRWWRQEQANEQSVTYAVMHRDFGFSGICGLALVGDVAFFYFWMGTDCQGKGYGPRATALVAQQAVRLGINALYTAVFPDNKPSQKALEKADFKRLAVKGLAKGEPVWFYGCGLDDDWQLETCKPELVYLLERMGSGFSVIG